MTRVAFTLIGGKNWTGGYNYLLNLVKVLAEQQAGAVTPVLFFGTDVDGAEAAPFAALHGVEVVHSPLLNQGRRLAVLANAIVRGRDHALTTLFDQHGIDLVFEAALYFGWRPGVPAIAWIPDLQHRVAPKMFTRLGGLKRDFGFRAQVASGREIMLSSEHARRTCEHYYPPTKGRTHVVRFAVLPPEPIAPAAARAIADLYGLPETFIYLPNQFWQHKNHIQVLEALSLLRARGKPIVIAASGKQSDGQSPEYFPRVLEMIGTLGVQEQFRLLGLIPYAHLSALMQASVALLNPSTYEGWSTTVEEARVRGVPMILSDIPVHREQMGDQATYFDLHNPGALADVLQAFQPLQADQRRARVDAAQLSAVAAVSRFASEFVTVVDAAVAKKPKPS